MGGGDPQRSSSRVSIGENQTKKQSLLLSVGGYHIVNSYTIVPQKYSERGSIESTQMCNLIELQVLDKKHRYMFGRAIALSPNFSRGKKFAAVLAGFILYWACAVVWCVLCGLYRV